MTAVLAFGLLFFGQVHAEETNDRFNFGENVVQLSDTLSIQAVNERERSTLQITDAGKVIYEKNLAFIQVTGFHQVDLKGNSYGVITYRHAGSANALFFEVIKLDPSKVELVYTSEIFEGATFEINEEQITVQYPDYAEADSMAAPSEILTQNFTIKDNVIDVGEVEKVDFKDGMKGKLQGVDYRYTNPSYEEISRLLTDKAIEADIPPEVLKGIAHMESRWKQYFDENDHDFIANSQRCENWDGTNVTLGSDCIGIGIMQVSDYIYQDEGEERDRYIERLKHDIGFNIDEGIRILKQKWNYSNAGITPTVNDNDPMYLDNWYFAIMAYNGMLPRNNPLNEENTRPTYQDSVYERILLYQHADVAPFPIEILRPYYLENGNLAFRDANYHTPGPLTYSAQTLKSGAVAYVKGGVTLREEPNPDDRSNIIKTLPAGTEVTLIGDYETNNNVARQYNWLPVETSAGDIGWLASGYLDFEGVYNLSGENRFVTSTAISKHGWKEADTVIIGRGDLPIDALTGSVLASGLDSPLLLTHNYKLTEAVKQELLRLRPSQIYILGGEGAIEPKVEQDLKKLYKNVKVTRIKDSNRSGTAAKVAEKIAERHDVKEVFITTGNEKSSDPLAIAPYAGENNIPILLTGTNKLSEPAQVFIEDNDISKVTIIGGKGAVSANVEKQLKSIVGSQNVERVSGEARFDTNLAIINKYYDVEKLDNIFVAQGLDIADALSAAPLAAKKQSPLMLTLSNKVPDAVNTWLTSKVTTKPDLYFLGGNGAINKNVKNEIVDKVK